MFLDAHISFVKTVAIQNYFFASVVSEEKRGMNRDLVYFYAISFTSQERVIHLLETEIKQVSIINRAFYKMRAFLEQMSTNWDL